MASAATRGMLDEVPPLVTNIAVVRPYADLAGVVELLEPFRNLPP